MACTRASCALSLASSRIRPAFTSPTGCSWPSVDPPTKKNTPPGTLPTDNLRHLLTAGRLQSVRPVVLAGDAGQRVGVPLRHRVRADAGGSVRRSGGAALRQEHLSGTRRWRLLSGTRVVVMELTRVPRLISLCAGSGRDRAQGAAVRPRDVLCLPLQQPVVREARQRREVLGPPLLPAHLLARPGSTVGSRLAAMAKPRAEAVPSGRINLDSPPAVSANRWLGWSTIIADATCSSWSASATESSACECARARGGGVLPRTGGIELFGGTLSRAAPVRVTRHTSAGGYGSERI
jgi:hypothetical protein